MSEQASLDFGGTGDGNVGQHENFDEATVPEIQGLSYVPDFLSSAEQKRTLETIDRSGWMDDLERAVQHYGWRYDYRSRVVTADMHIGPLPDWLNDIAQRLLSVTDSFDRVPDQAIVNNYEPGQGIAMHVDRHCFGDTVATVSLGDTWQMDFRPLGGDRSATVHMALAPGSALILSGDARNLWLHGIAKRRRERCQQGGWRPRMRRVSVTFRTTVPQRVRGEDDRNFPN
ncbi:MAG: alpha-ketoglutarate-dependent dioxygenase AlkB [Gammaproteobacteria bacterium]|nr:alpha-ketoglutarate-dependent dioxygenase AlkB [Gammaproteobacteria bacterium]MDE0366622.1 alpha-ketoglutarate-dependent dioxygenase AlkB [Gammaproteobacteria bacterium]